MRASRWRIGILLVASAAASLPALIASPRATSATLQDFDAAASGTPYTLTRHDATTSPGASAIAGGPSGRGRLLRLAFEEPVPSHNSVAFDRTAAGAAAVVVADFDFRITPADTRADGFGFALLNTALYGNTGGVAPEGPLFRAEEPNFRGSLGIGFDVWQNQATTQDAGDTNANHVSLHWNGRERREFDVTDALDLARGDWVHARIEVRAAPAFQDVTIVLTPLGGRPSTVVDHFRIADLVPYESRVYFAARAGGESADHDIDNVNVQYLSATDATVALDALAVAGFETDARAEVSVTRRGDLTSAITVGYTTRDGSATAGADYQRTDGALSFAAGETSKTISVPILNDATDEGDETFFVDLVDGSGATVTGTRTATITVGDDEAARQAGHWTPRLDWPIVAIHTHMMPNGQVLAFDRAPMDPGMAEHTFSGIRAWDPATNVISAAALPGYDIFCSSHSFLGNGTLLVLGGHNMADFVGLANASLYDGPSNSWLALPDMNKGRWYPTSTTLASGDVLVFSGSATITDENRVPQVWDHALGSWRDLTGVEGTLPPQPVNWSENLYPKLFLAPDGRVLMAGPSPVTGFIDTAGIGLWTNGPPRALHRNYGSAVMYDGKVLMIGGSAAALDANPPTASIEELDLTASTLAWNTSLPPMHFGRRHNNATLLPDGQVFVSGGTSSPGFKNAAGAVLDGEIWDPVARTWTLTAKAAVKRIYHSTAVLLPDGRVLVGGGGKPVSEGDVDHYNVEIFSPPYLFKGPRPTIASAPSRVTWGDTFTVQSPDASSIAKATLIRLGSVTHTFDENQRLVTLPITLVTGGLRLTVPTANVAPPGHYFLSIVNASGVPSMSSIVQVIGAPEAPTVSAVPDLSTAEDTAVTASLVVNDGDSGPSVVTLSAASSNPSVVPASGVAISGTGFTRRLTITPAANASGTATVTLTATDGALSTVRAFRVTVTAVNDAPTISAIANQTIAAGASTGALSFTIGDVETPSSGLSVTATSSDTPVVASTGISLGGSGASRTIQVTPVAGATGTSRITLTVSDGALAQSASFLVTVGTSIQIAPRQLSFGARFSGGVFTAPPLQSIAANVFGPGPVQLSATSDRSWIAPIASGSGGQQLVVGIVATGLPTSGVANGTITIQASGAVQSTVTVAVQVTVTGAATAPFGVFDTPANNSTGLAGAIAVTGWALDDVGIERVEVWRNCVESIDRLAGACAAAEPGGAANFVFVGTGAFVDGARPDVAAAFPAVPRQSRAGWGYLLLTNALPHVPNGTEQGGQGAFVLTAIAVDAEGQRTVLGTKSILVDNDHSTSPFGGVDTPGQGALVSWRDQPPYGDPNAYPSFGWAMTQAGKCIDVTDVTRFKVYIDGVSRPLTPGVNWFSGLSRSDLAASFPGLCNSSNALAVYYINAAALGLSSGLHTIGWEVTDDQGRTAGFGSRFFTLLLQTGDPADFRRPFAVKRRRVRPRRRSLGRMEG